MKRILVPTDFSPTAEKAFHFALEIAAKSSGSIILYHAYKPIERAITITDKTRNEYNKQAETNLLKKLNRLKKKLTADYENVPVSTIVGHTPVINNILGFAEHNDIDLIVMGTQGVSGLKKVILGSVAAKIANKTDIPVLLVPEKYKWKQPERIVFSTNFQKDDKAALSLALALAKYYSIGVAVLHLSSAYLTAIEKQKEKDDFNTYAYHLQRKFNKYKLKFELLETTSVSDTLENLDKQIPHDILVMVRREKSFYEKAIGGSFTQTMASLAKKPMLIVPEGAQPPKGVETAIEEKADVKKEVKKEVKKQDVGDLLIKKIKHKVKP